MTKSPCKYKVIVLVLKDESAKLLDKKSQFVASTNCKKSVVNNWLPIEISQSQHNAFQEDQVLNQGG